MEIARDIFHFPSFAFNWYVVREGGRLTVIDTGFPGHYSLLLKGLQSIGHGVNDVEAVLITHAHADHTGFAERLSRDSGAPVYVHEADVEAARRPLQLPWYGLLSRSWRPFTCSLLGHATFNGIFSLPTITKPRPFRDDVILDVPGRPRVIHLPGHTPGEVGFHLPDRGIFISGDAIVTRSLHSGRQGAPQIPHKTLNADTRAARKSLDRLRELGKATILPGHGRPWSGELREAVELAQEGRQVARA